MGTVVTRMVLRWLPWLVAAGCGGTVIVDGAAEGAADGSSNVPDSETMGDDPDIDDPPPATGWAPIGPGPCLSCDAWLATCGGPCVHPDAACAGAQAERVDDVIACVCAGCADICGGSCVMFSGNAACVECQQQALTNGCYFERDACNEG
jgi:hypothetical protein